MRRWLSVTLDDLVKAFLSLNLDFLPQDINEPGPQIIEENVIYHLNRGGYNNVKVNHIERGRISSTTLEDLRRWLGYVDRMHNSAIMPV